MPAVAIPEDVTPADGSGSTFLTEIVQDPGAASRPGPGMSGADVMTLLDHERMGDLSAQFSLYPGSALNLVEFVRVVTKFLPGIRPGKFGPGPNHALPISYGTQAISAS